MADIKQIGSTVEADAEKVESAARTAVADAEQDQAQAVSWVEEHPRMALLAGGCLGLAVIVILIEVLKHS